MQLSPTTIATTILESDTPTALSNILAELMGLDPNNLPDSHMVQIIYAELSKELARLQRKQDQLQSLLDNAGPSADLDAKALVSDELEYAKSDMRSVRDILLHWKQRYPRCIPKPPITLARAKFLLSCQPK